MATKQILKNVFDIETAKGEKITRKIKLLMDNLEDWQEKRSRVNGRQVRGYFRKNIQ